MQGRQLATISTTILQTTELKGKGTVVLLEEKPSTNDLDGRFLKDERVKYDMEAARRRALAGPPRETT